MTTTKRAFAPSFFWGNKMRSLKQTLGATALSLAALSGYAFDVVAPSCCDVYRPPDRVLAPTAFRIGGAILVTVLRDNSSSPGTTLASVTLASCDGAWSTGEFASVAVTREREHLAVERLLARLRSPTSTPISLYPDWPEHPVLALAGFRAEVDLLCEAAAPAPPGLLVPVAISGNQLLSVITGTEALTGSTVQVWLHLAEFESRSEAVRPVRPMGSMAPPRSRVSELVFAGDGELVRAVFQCEGAMERVIGGGVVALATHVGAAIRNICALYGPRV